VTRVLTTEDDRDEAARLIDTHSGGYRVDGRVIADVLDGVSSVVLAVAGVTDPTDARAVLRLLWGVR
jgi:hypothetical protein